MEKANLIKKLLRENKPYSQIVQEVECSKSTISYHAKKLGLSKGTVPKYNWREINNFYHSQSNIRVKDCVEKFGFSSGTWYKAVQRGDILPKDKIISNDKIFIQNSTFARSHIRKRVLKDNLILYICAKCFNEVTAG